MSNRAKRKNPHEGKIVKFVHSENDPENADGVCGHLEEIGIVEYKPSFYENYLKRGLDILISFTSLLLLSPVLLMITLAIKIEDPGPAIFTQTRIGKNKKYFTIHKFRSMKMSTPKDIPTHQLRDSEKFTTKFGAIMRKHSFDELPQIWDVFIGRMSFIGPRPALWNQDFLISERDKYGANDVKPGLTGLAQINGRDELDIPEKARIDGYYCNQIGFKIDFKIFFHSFFVFIKDEDIK